MTTTIIPAIAPLAAKEPAAPVQERGAILVVDDSFVDRRIVGRLLDLQGGWKVAYAVNGAEALTAMQKQTPRIVLTDMQMPVMDGLTLVEQIREQYPHVPVVLMTATGSEEIAVQALKAGASSYVPKRNLKSQLLQTLDQVLFASQIDGCRQRMLGCLTERKSRFTLENDSALIGPIVMHLQEDLLGMGICDATGAMRTGIALEEAFLNALFHGNLEVSSSLRDHDRDDFHRLAGERNNVHPYKDRRIRLIAEVTPTEAHYVIVDQGPGFDIAKLPDPTDPANLEKPSGRGILLMRTFMDKVTFSAGGSQVTLVKRRERK